MTRNRAFLFASAAALLGLLLGLLFAGVFRHPAPPAAVVAVPAKPLSPSLAGPAAQKAPITLWAHNLLLRKGPQFRIYIRWIRGEMRRTKADENPSFDDPDSFVLEIQKGVIRANIGDLANFLNSSSKSHAPLTNISIQPKGEQLVLRGTLHKLIPIPVSLQGTLTPTPNGLVRFHLTHLDVLKLPVKWLLGDLHLQLSDFIPKTGMAGIKVAGNDIFFDTERLLPPPHIHGRLTSVRVQVPDIQVVYGNASSDEAKLSRWHNFLRLTGGTLDFGKLTMHNVDLTMIDASTDPWFDLDLVHYQAQLVNGYTRMTAQAGLEIFMPDLDDGAVKKKVARAITNEWLRNRWAPLPAGVPVH